MNQHARDDLRKASADRPPLVSSQVVQTADAKLIESAQRPPDTSGDLIRVYAATVSRELAKAIVANTR